MSLRRVSASLIASFILLVLPSAASALKFTPAAGSPITNSGNVIVMSAVGDFNEDGRDDIAFVDATDKIQVKLGQSDGTFVTAPDSPFSTSIPSTSVLTSIRAGDFDGDGHFDLVAGSGNFWGVLSGDGTGRFTQTGSFQVPWAMPKYRGTTNDYANVIGDVDGDGDPDLVFGMYQTGFDVVLNNGDGTFSPQPVTYFLPEADREANGFDGMLSPVLGDFNGDGNVDLAAALRPETQPTPATAGVYVANGDGAGNFTPDNRPPLLSEASYFNSISSLKLNAGPADDVAAAFTGSYPDSQSNLFTLLGGTGGLSPNPSPLGNLYSGYYPYQQTTGDLDGDGRTDILVGARGDYSAVLVRNNGDGTIAPFAGSPVLLPQVDGNNFSVNGIYAGDFNGDGALDMAADSSHSGQAFQARGIDVLLSRPGLAASPSSLDFGSVQTGSESDPLTVTLTNDGPLPVDLAGPATVTGDNADQFTAGAGTCGSSIADRSSCTRTVTFVPSSPGSKQATFHQPLSGADAIDIPLTGTASSPPPEPARLTLKATAPKKVKRGKVLTIRLRVSNPGGLAASQVKLGVAVPRRTASAVRPVKIGDLSGGQVLNRSVKVKVKKSARKGSRLKVTVTATATGLKVKSVVTATVR